MEPDDQPIRMGCRLLLIGGRQRPATKPLVRLLLRLQARALFADYGRHQPRSRRTLQLVPGHEPAPLLSCRTSVPQPTPYPRPHLPVGAHRRCGGREHLPITLCLPSGRTPRTPSGRSREGRQRGFVVLSLVRPAQAQCSSFGKAFGSGLDLPEPAFPKSCQWRAPGQRALASGEELPLAAAGKVS